MNFKRLEKFIYDKMIETRLPGVSAGLIHNGEVIWAKGFGVNDLRTTQPATPDTLYGIASLTKSFTALAIMQLAEQGKLTIDDPISDHVPIDIRPYGEPIRIKHLLAHTSGIGALGSSEKKLRVSAGALDGWLPLSTAEDLYRYLDGAEDWVVAKPGERWLYLNEGYLLLGQIIANASGIGYEDYIRQNILAPLGMNRTFFKPSELEADHDVTTPHLITADSQRPTGFPFNMLSSAGRLASNVNDLLRYLQMYLNGGEFNGTRIASEKIIKEMMTPRVNTLVEGGYFGQPQYGYGLGMSPDVFGKRMVGHGGSITVCTSYMAMLPEENLGAVILVNGTGYATMQMAVAALGTVFDIDPADLPFEHDERIMQKLIGCYESFRGNTSRTVTRNASYLMLHNKDKFSEEITPLAVESLSEERCIFTIPEPQQRVTVEFRIKDDRVDMVYDRYLLRKTF